MVARVVTAPRVAVVTGSASGIGLATMLAALGPLEASIGTATLDAVLFLADDLHGHHRGSVIRIPSGVTT
jgi:hypothetical protein